MSARGRAARTVRSRAMVFEPVGTTADVGEMLGISVRMARQMAEEGRFGNAAFKVGGQWRFRMAGIADLYSISYREEDPR